MSTDRRSSDLVAEAGAALYGPEWTGQLARALDLNERTVRRIKAASEAGEAYPVAPGVLIDLKRLLLARGAALRALADRL